MHKYWDKYVILQLSIGVFLNAILYIIFLSHHSEKYYWKLQGCRCQSQPEVQTGLVKGALFVFEFSKFPIPASQLLRVPRSETSFETNEYKIYAKIAVSNEAFLFRHPSWLDVGLKMRRNKNLKNGPLGETFFFFFF